MKVEAEEPARTKRPHVCSNCGNAGHNRQTCAAEMKARAETRGRTLGPALFSAAVGLLDRSFSAALAYLDDAPAWPAAGLTKLVVGLLILWRAGGTTIELEPGALRVRGACADLRLERALKKLGWCAAGGAWWTRP